MICKGNKIKFYQLYIQGFGANINSGGEKSNAKCFNVIKK